MIWDTAFEGTPAGSDFASVVSSKLRDMKSLFKTMMLKEHTFDEAISPIMSHKSGYCSILGREVTDIAENALSIVEGSFKYSDGTQYIILGSFNHQDLDDRDLDDAHTQYVLKTNPVFGDITVSSLTNILSVHYPTTKGDTVVVRRDSHLNNVDVGDDTPNHVDNCIPTSDIQCTLNNDAALLVSGSATTGYWKPASVDLMGNLTGYNSVSGNYYGVGIIYDLRSSGGGIQLEAISGDTIRYTKFAE